MANMKCSLPSPLMGSILSFTVHGHDVSELNRIASISPKFRKAIDCNPTLFNTEEPLLEIREHKDESLNGVWYLKTIKTNVQRPIQVPGTEQMTVLPNPYRGIQNAEIHTKGYAFTRERNGELQEIFVLSRKIVPLDFFQDRPQLGEPGWKAYRMDHYKEMIYDLRLTFPFDQVESMPADARVFFADKKTVGQDLWSERCERLLRFNHEQRPIRPQDRSSNKNPANYTALEPGVWIQFTTPLKPVFSDPKFEMDRYERLAAKHAHMEEQTKSLLEVMKGQSQEEIMQSDEYQQHVQQLAEWMQTLQNEAPEISEQEYAEAWARGEKEMEFFRIRLFDTSGSLAP